MTNTRIGIALVLLLGTVPAATAWGPVAHQAVIARAIDTLPGGIKSFYKDHRLEIPSLAPDTQPSEEGREQRFAVDRLLPFPFAELPRTEDALKGRFGDAAQEVGRLPWLITNPTGAWWRR